VNEIVSRVVIVSEIASVGEQKSVGERNLALVEFRVKGVGLRCNAWGDMAAKVPPAGTDVVVEGRLNTRSYLHQESQQQRETTEIVVSSITLLDAAPAVRAQPAEAPSPTTPQLPTAGF
jgi:single-stranded DNA-binding protein